MERGQFPGSFVYPAGSTRTSQGCDPKTHFRSMLEYLGSALISDRDAMATMFALPSESTCLSQAPTPEWLASHCKIVVLVGSGL